MGQLYQFFDSGQLTWFCKSQLRKVWDSCGGKENWGIDESLLDTVFAASKRLQLGVVDDEDGAEYKGEENGDKDDGWEVENLKLAAVYDVL